MHVRLKATGDANIGTENLCLKLITGILFLRNKSSKDKNKAQTQQQLLHFFSLNCGNKKRNFDSHLQRLQKINLKEIRGKNNVNNPNVKCQFFLVRKKIRIFRFGFCFVGSRVGVGVGVGVGFVFAEKGQTEKVSASVSTPLTVGRPSHKEEIRR